MPFRYLEDAKQLLLKGKLSGEVIAPVRHRLKADLKAVTLDRFTVVKKNNKWKATAILDV